MSHAPAQEASATGQSAAENAEENTSQKASGEGATKADTDGKTTPETTDKGQSGDQKSWKALKGKWEPCQFGGDGEVEIGADLIKFGFGDPLTGIRWEGDVLKENFEIELEARRTEGFDFFCGLTFPVGENNVTFVLGGWGGGVVGISSVDGYDASENDTTDFRNFDNEDWYKVRVRVDPFKIRCWINDKIACTQYRKGHEFDIRYEMDPCVPLGVAAFQCKAEYRGARVRQLTAKELVEAKKEAEEDNE